MTEVEFIQLFRDTTAAFENGGEPSPQQDEALKSLKVSDAPMVFRAFQALALAALDKYNPEFELLQAFRELEALSDVTDFEELRPIFEKAISKLSA